MSRVLVYRVLYIYHQGMKTPGFYFCVFVPWWLIGAWTVNRCAFEGLALRLEEADMMDQEASIRRRSHWRVQVRYP